MLFRVLILLVCCGLTLPLAQGAIIGSYAGSSRSWNDADMSIMKATAIAAGHTVLPNGPMSAAALAGVDVFVMGEVISAPSGAEIADLLSWLSGGGIGLVFFDSSCGGCGGGNPILSGIGSGMSASGSASGATAFPSSPFTTSPYALVGLLLSTTPGSAISGGTALAGDYIHYAGIGSGWVFAFGDRSDHNFFTPTSSTVNGQLFLDILAAARSGLVIPEPSSLVLLGAGLGLLALKFRLRRR